MNYEMENTKICSKVENCMTSVDTIFNEFSGVLKNNNVQYDDYDRILFKMFRKLMVRWKGFSLLLNNKQAENADIFMRTIFELQICLEFILLETNPNTISNRVASYSYNAILQQLKAVCSGEEYKKKKEELLSIPIYKKVSDDITKKKAKSKYNYFWADLYCDNKLNNFSDVFEYINGHYNLNEVSSFNNFMRYRYKTLSTELHSNILQVRSIDSNYYTSNYTTDELFLIIDSLILFDTILGDFLDFLMEKYSNVIKIEDKDRIKSLRSDLLDIILN